MPGVFVPYCSVFLPSHIETPQYPHTLTSHEPEYHLNHLCSMLSILLSMFHRIRITYDGDVTCPQLANQARKGSSLYDTPSSWSRCCLPPPSVATPRDVGASEYRVLSLLCVHMCKLVLNLHTISQSLLSTHISAPALMLPYTYIAVTVSTQDTTQITRDDRGGGSEGPGPPGLPTSLPTGATGACSACNCHRYIGSGGDRCKRHMCDHRPRLHSVRR
ncbi:hypothetical protein DFH94DRAFT_713159 [Russula ochroleuca]|uniref:Uncharacterized protein n=1 Tax=Russula ochroleuca TaxID=152965 RepID=A0A9P5N5I2_9AGAM|nr:hypothetical protein DFH94DRAFT_713159 [Russula ochroleuca]